MPRPEHARHDLAEAAEARDDHVLVAARRHLVVGLLLLARLAPQIVDHKQERRRRHGEGDGQGEQIGEWPVDDAF